MQGQSEIERKLDDEFPLNSRSPDGHFRLGSWDGNVLRPPLARQGQSMASIRVSDGLNPIQKLPFQKLAGRFPGKFFGDFLNVYKNVGNHKSGQ